MDAFRRSIAVVVGIDRYGSGIPRLGSARRDAERLGTLLRDAHGYDVRSLLDEQATGEQLLRVLTHDLAEELGPEDRLLFYYAGHGVALDGDGGVNGYLLPADAQRGVETSYLHMPRIHDALVALGCRHMLVVLDCCFAGAFRWSSTRDLIALPSVIHQERLDRFVKSPAWQVITSAASDQTALDQLSAGPLGSRGEGAHSPFALALFEGLAGGGDVVPAGGGDGVITATELYVYIEDRLQPATIEAGAGQTPRLWPLRRHDKGEFIFLVPGRELNLPPAPPLDYAANPYVGLRSYEVAEADLFFGRGEVVRDLFGHVQTHALTAVLGASGTGKSSVVKAGLLPFIATHDAALTVAPVVRPGPDPIESLQRALASVDPGAFDAHGQPATAATIEAGVAEWCRRNGDRRLVLVVDQLEELITLAHDRGSEAHVVDLLERLLATHAEQLRIVVTLRSDFEPALAELAWSARWADARFVIRPMTQDELRQVIEAPASRRVLYFEPSALVDELINEVVATPGGLPLLSFALSEMYIHFVDRRSSDRAITEEDYHAVGGVIGALRARADREYQELDAAHRETMRRVMLRMVALGAGGGVRRRVWRSELVFDDEAENARVAHVLERLSSARLIVQGHEEGGEPWVEPAHDALVGAWNLLIGWVREANAGGIADLRFQRALGQVARDWSGETDPKVRDGLLWKDAVRGGILGKLTAAEASGLNRQERAFARRSIRSRRRARAALVATLAVIVLLAAGAVVAAFRASANARQARDEASAARGALLGRMAVTAEVPGHDDTEVIRLLLAAEAVRLGASTAEIHRIPDAENAIRRAAAGSRGIRLTGHQDPIPRQVNSSSWSHFTADGRWLLTGNLLDSHARVWDLEAARPSEAHHILEGLLSRSPTPPAVVSAGSRLFTVMRSAGEARIEVRDTRRSDWDEQGRVLDVAVSDIGDVVASADGRWLAGAADEGDAWLIDLADAALTPRVLTGTTGPVAFSENGDWLVTGGAGGVLIHDLRRAGEAPRAIPGIDAAFAIGPDANWLVGTADGAGTIVHAPSARASGVVEGLDRYADFARPIFSPDGGWLIHCPYHDTCTTWRLDSGTGVAEPIETATQATLANEGALLVSAPSAERIVVRELATGRAADLAGARPPFRTHGRLLAARAAAGAAALWDLADSGAGPFLSLAGAGEPVAWGGDGEWLVTLGEDTPDALSALQFWAVDAGARHATLEWTQQTDLGALDSPVVSTDGRWWLNPGTSGSHLLAFAQIRSGSELRGLPPISAHAWATAAGLLVTGHADGTVRAWETGGDGPVRRALAEGPGEVIWLDVSADAQRLLTQHPAELLVWQRDSTGFAVVANANVLDLDPDALARSPARAVLADMDRLPWTIERGPPPIGFGADGTTIEAMLADGRVASWRVDSVVTASRAGRASRSVKGVTAMPTGSRWTLTSNGDTVEVRDARRPDGPPLRFGGRSVVISDDDRWLVEGCSGFTADSRWVYSSMPEFWRVDARERGAFARPAGSESGEGGLETQASCVIHELTGRSRRPDTLFATSAVTLPEPGGGGGPVGMQLSPDGRWAVVRWGYNLFPDCGYTSDVRLMDLHAADPVSTLVPIERSESGGCPRIDFAPGGRWLGAGALLRDLAPHADPAQSFWLPGPIRTFDPAGRFVVTDSETEWESGIAPDEAEPITLRFIAIDTDALIDQACLLAGRNPSFEEWRRFFPGEPYRLICPRLPAPREADPTSR